jgi:HPt (histidine-containing phosphotransfer) domain-containing protein
MTEIVELFLDESSRLAEAIRQAIGANSSVDLRSAAHALKGSVANFSAPRVYQAATRLESMGAEGRLSGAMEAWFNLQDELAMLAAVLMRLRRNSPTL